MASLVFASARRPPAPSGTGGPPGTPASLALSAAVAGSSPDMTTGRFDAVLFDAGGVLVMPDPTVLAPLLAPLGGSVDPAVHHRAHYAAMRAVDRAEQEDWTLYHRAYVASVGVPAHELDEAIVVFSATFNLHLWRYPNEGSAAALRTLVERAIPIGVVSNAGRPDRGRPGARRGVPGGRGPRRRRAVRGRLAHRRHLEA